MDELFSSKSDGRGTIYDSHENRFAGRASTEKRVRECLTKRLEELKKEGFAK